MSINDNEAVIPGARRMIKANYLRLLERGGVNTAAEAAIVGSESSVTDQIGELFNAGATDVWAARFRWELTNRPYVIVPAHC